MASSVEKKTKAADSEPEWMKSLLANLEQLRSSWRACEDEDFSWIEEHKNLIRPGEFLVATSNVKVDVSGNDVQDTEVDNPDVEPEDEDVSPEALAEEGESDDDSSTTIKDYLGDTYNNHIMAINKVVATRKPIEIASNVFPHSWQLNGATKMRRLEQSFFQGGILADEMGLGKTLVALLLINMTRSIRAGPSLVICPKSCVKQWMRELSDNFKPEHRLKCIRLRGTSVTAATVLEYDVVVATYQYVQRQYSIKKNFVTAMSSGHSAPPRPILSIFSELYTDLGLPFQRVILDESQNAKNTNGPTFAAIKAIDAKSTIMLSATFMDNKWLDCWGAIALLKGHPIRDNKTFKDVFGTRNTKGQLADPSQIKIFRLQKFLQGLVVARPGSLLELPGREEHDICFELSESESIMDTIYMDQCFRSGGGVEYDFSADDNKARLKAVIRAMQASSHHLLEKQAVEIEDLDSDDDDSDPTKENPATGISKENPWLAMIRKGRMAVDSSRVQAFLEVYRGVKLRYPHERVAVWSVMRKFLDIIEVALEQELSVSCLRYDGRVDEKGRDRVLQQFKAEGALKPLLITAKAGGVALNIQDATVIVQLEIWWNRNTERQAYARAHRQGQENNVKIYRLQARNGRVDAEMLRVQQKKTRINEELMAPLVRADDEEPKIPEIY